MLIKAILLLLDTINSQHGQMLNTKDFLVSKCQRMLPSKNQQFLTHQTLKTLLTGELLVQLMQLKIKDNVDRAGHSLLHVPLKDTISSKLENSLTFLSNKQQIVIHNLKDVMEVGNHLLWSILKVKVKNLLPTIHTKLQMDRALLFLQKVKLK